MPATIIEPISTVVSPDTEQENDFELDIRVTISNPTDTEEGASGIGNSCGATRCGTCTGCATCNHSCASVWYVWCCN